MALFAVVPELRQRGLNVDLASSYFWVAQNHDLRADSCGIFVFGASKLGRIFSSCFELEAAHKDFLGPVLAREHHTFTAPKPKAQPKAKAQSGRASGPASLPSGSAPTLSASGLASASQSSVKSRSVPGPRPILEDFEEEQQPEAPSAPAPAAAAGPEPADPEAPAVGRKGWQPKKEHPKLLRFGDAAAGFPLDCYRPLEDHTIEESMTASWTKDVPPPDSSQMPELSEMRLAHWIFDPTQSLFKGGAHMPLLIQLGVRGGRSDEKLTEREAKKRAKKAAVKEFREAAEELRRTTGESACAPSARPRSRGRRGPRADPATAAAPRLQAETAAPYPGSSASSSARQPHASAWAWQEAPWDDAPGAYVCQQETGSSWPRPTAKGGPGSSRSSNDKWQGGQWRAS